MPLAELGGTTVASLEDLFGHPGSELAERIRLTADWDLRFDLVERFLLERLADGPRPTPACEWAWSRLRQSCGTARVEAIADEIGCSRRYLGAKFREEVGIPPKTAGRLIRLEQVCRRMRADPTEWAEVAADAGFYDQPHLNREFRDLAGITPSEFLSRCIPGGGVLGDGV
jgi:AraC-like DNA-binding protein